MKNFSTNRLVAYILGVAHALLRAASALVPPQVLSAALLPAPSASVRTHGFKKRSHECERGTQECVRHATSVRHAKCVRYV